MKKFIFTILSLLFINNLYSQSINDINIEDYKLNSQITSLLVEEIKNRSGWQNIGAVKNNKIFVINSDCFSRPGPRVTDGTLIMYLIIHPEQL